MKATSFIKIGLVLTGMLLVLTPLVSYGQSRQAPPPVGARLVREGDFAAALEAGLGLGAGRSELEAEDRLAALGIMPRNGWMADYPVTPDILGELQESVGTAADSGKLSLRRDDALQRFDVVAYGAGLLERPFANAGTYSEPGAVESYRDPEAVYGYYADQGPPAVTYYAPPSDYYDLYSFVPYPFWYSTFWFPGFFVLRDFHRHHGHGFVSNHFVHGATSSFARVDPVLRAQGSTVRTFRAAGLASSTRGSTLSGGSAPSSTTTGPRIITIGGPRAAVSRPGTLRANGSPAIAPQNAIRTQRLGSPRVAMLSSTRIAMVGGGARAAPSFGSYHGSSIGGSSLRGGSAHGGGSSRGGGGHRR
jgi:hypothetical protein